MRERLIIVYGGKGEKIYIYIEMGEGDLEYTVDEWKCLTTVNVSMKGARV